MLIAFGGLPGTGKSTLARALAAKLGAVWLRIDSLEQALRRSGALVDDIGPAGYMGAGALAGDNLRLGHVVIADSVNPLPVTRSLWAEVANAAGARLVEVEIVCSDPAIHRTRIEGRNVDVAGLVQPDWAAVLARQYLPWPGANRIDTAGRSADDCLEDILALAGVNELPRRA